jgi:hypothetical protein
MQLQSSVAIIQHYGLPFNSPGFGGESRKTGTVSSSADDPRLYLSNLCIRRYLGMSHVVYNADIPFCSLYTYADPVLCVICKARLKENG